MGILQSEYTRGSSGLHLRDYRHAQNLYYTYGLAFAPKTKFLYHCLFEPSPEIGNSADKNSFAFQKQLGVLVKSADLPGFRVSVDNKKQYNRIKQFQTRIDYQDVNITFHDDNVGVTRALFEEYYKYYFVDGSHNVQKNALVSGPYATRDKYATTVPKYGLNNGTVGPFFTSITLYQLSRQQYFAYTLVNPIITQWDHGSVDAADGSGMNENKMSIAYEAVLYTNGPIGEDSQPVAFADAETGYDQSPSPLAVPDNSIDSGPKLLQPSTFESSVLSRSSFTETSTRSFLETNSNNTFFTPKTDLKNSDAVITAPAENTYKKYDAATIQGALGSRPSGSSPIKGQDRLRARYAFTASAINSGAVPGVPNMTDYKRLTAQEQNAITNSLVDKAAGGDAKLANMASDAIGKVK
jgi:hypothetical protein